MPDSHRNRRKQTTGNKLMLVALAGLLLVSVGFIVYLLSHQHRERERARILELSRQVKILLASYDDIFARHPDFVLPEQIRFVDSFQNTSNAELASRMPELSAAYRELAAAMLRRAMGPCGGDRSTPSATAYKTYSANGFKRLYEEKTLDGVTPFDSAPEVTGDDSADQRIKFLAEKRGYRLRGSVDEAGLVEVDGKRLRPQAAAAWRGLKQAAAAEGIELGLVSAYRSAAYQRRIFLNLLRIEGQKRLSRRYSAQEIASGVADAAIDVILRESSVPGYSKHHTGYTIDITDAASGKPFTEFASTRGFQWISACNYLNAKRFGLIPSYPEGADDQGPEPEAWEYVWVGEENLRASMQSTLQALSAN